MRLSFTHVLAAATLTGLCVVAKTSTEQKIRQLISFLLEVHARQPEINPLVVRAQFGNIPCADLSAVQGHTHGKAAANRSTGSFQIDVLSRLLGRDAFFYQHSASDLRSGRKGSRSHFWIKDLNVPFGASEPGPDDLIAMIDVDQYVDMNYFMTKHFNPTLIYTFQPGTVCHSDGEYGFTFDAENKVRYLVDGGGDYGHLVWNYSGDSLKFTWKIFGLTMWTHVYQLERKQMDDHHQVLLLVPLAAFRGVWALVADIFLAGKSLERFSLVHGEYLRMTKKTSGKLITYTGRVGAHSCASVPAAVDDEIASVMRTSKVGLSLPMVKKKMGEDWSGAEILYEYHKLHTNPRVPQVTYHLDKYVRSYQWYDTDFEPEARPCIQSFMNALVPEAFAPSKCKSNDARAIKARVIDQRNVTHLTPHLMKVIEEFWDLTLGEEVGKLHPSDEEFLRAKQAKPSQQRILNCAEYLDADFRVSAFSKSEAHTSVNDGRNISTVNGVTKRDYSLFMYAMSEVIKKQEWYAFGKTPEEVAKRVATICEGATSVTKSDASRMDGNWSEVARYFERRGMIKAFRPEYHDELNEQMDHIVNCVGSTAFGVSYLTLLSKLSGEPGTSTMNTALNACITFATFRAMRTPTGYLTKIQAWLRMGIYGGDDGLTADIVAVVYVKIALKFGQKYVADPVKRGQLGIEFLARQFGPDVWWGEVDSCCKFLRTMSKFHTAVAMPSNITPAEKLFDKAYALYLTDKNTPIIGEFVSRVVELCKGQEFKNLNSAWRVSFEADVQYPNVKREWMDALFEQELPDFDVNKFREWLPTANMEAMLKSPVFMLERAAKMKPGVAVVDGDIVKSEEVEKAEKTAVTTSNQTGTKIRRPSVRATRQKIIFRKKTTE
jgi:hypothetical protein